MVPYTRIHTHTPRYTHSLTHAHTHTHIHTYTHTHTHTHPCSWSHTFSITGETRAIQLQRQLEQIKTEKFRTEAERDELKHKAEEAETQVRELYQKCRELAQENQEIPILRDSLEEMKYLQSKVVSLAGDVQGEMDLYLFECALYVIREEPSQVGYTCYVTDVRSFTSLPDFSHAILKSWEGPMYKARVSHVEQFLY